VSSVKGAVQALNKQLPFRPITTLQQLVSSSIASPQFVLVLMAAFGVIGQFLAALGLFGLVNHLVVQRTHEMGLRIALGAAPIRIVQALVGERIRLAGIGVAVGLVGAIGLTRALSGLMYGVQPADPLAFAGAILLVLMVAAVASYLPWVAFGPLYGALREFCSRCERRIAAGAHSAPASRGPHGADCAPWRGTERSGAKGSLRATEPGCGADPT
jgi:ABC-type antimicrobial peptide transport system permease subunit